MGNGDWFGWDVNFLTNVNPIRIGNTVVGSQSGGGDPVFFGDSAKGFALADGVAGRLAKRLAKPQQC